MNYRKTKEFEKDFKKLKRKFSTLDQDFEIFKKSSLELFHLHRIPQNIMRIQRTGQTGIPIYKVRKFACRSLKGTGSMSGIRIIYAYLKDLNTIDFIEIYYKGDKTTEDSDRIEKYLKNRK